MEIVVRVANRRHSSSSRAANHPLANRALSAAATRRWRAHAVCPGCPAGRETRPTPTVAADRHRSSLTNARSACRTTPDSMSYAQLAAIMARLSSHDWRSSHSTGCARYRGGLPPDGQGPVACHGMGLRPRRNRCHPYARGPATAIAGPVPCVSVATGVGSVRHRLPPARMMPDRPPPPPVRCCPEGGGWPSDRPIRQGTPRDAAGARPRPEHPATTPEDREAITPHRFHRTRSPLAC